MCGRYTLAGPAGGDLSALRSRFALGESLELRQRFNVAPTDDVPAVTASRDGEPRGELLRWGLVPRWAPDPSIGARMINARAETVAEKPAFRDAFAGRRCLIIADGFYEWQPRPGKPKLPWLVGRADGAPFAFAGLWAQWRTPEDERLRTCSIVTTTASPLLADVHPRMPVILPDAAAEDAWLDPATPTEVLHDLMAPLADDLTGRRPVGPAVNDARHDAPDCLDPASPDEPTLF